MIGVRRQVNPALRLAGDACRAGRSARGRARCARDFPENRFLVSVLSRENQHELCVYARKFAQPDAVRLLVVPEQPVASSRRSRRERLEMLGTSFIPQHSDARVLEQLIYKWRDTRRILAPILARSYRRLAVEWPAGDARGRRARRHAPVPGQLRAVDAGTSHGLRFRLKAETTEPTWGGFRLPSESCSFRWNL